LFRLGTEMDSRPTNVGAVHLNSSAPDRRLRLRRVGGSSTLAPPAKWIADAHVAGERRDPTPGIAAWRRRSATCENTNDAAYGSAGVRRTTLRDVRGFPWTVRFPSTCLPTSAPDDPPWCDELGGECGQDVFRFAAFPPCITTFARCAARRSLHTPTSAADDHTIPRFESVGDHKAAFSTSNQGSRRHCRFVLATCRKRSYRRSGRAANRVGRGRPWRGPQSATLPCGERVRRPHIAAKAGGLNSKSLTAAKNRRPRKKRPRKKIGLHILIALIARVSEDGRGSAVPPSPVGPACFPSSSG